VPGSPAWRETAWLQILDAPRAGDTYGSKVLGRAADNRPVLGYLQFPSIEASTEPNSAAGRGAFRRHLAARGEHVSIVDDEDAITAVTSAVLERLGYTTTCYSSGARFLKDFKAEPHRTNLVIVDVVMPEMSGVQLVTALRETGRDVPILLMTGFSVQSRLVSGGVAGRMAFVRKPFTTMHLAQSVRRLLSSAN
jgi:CheY-like chemotaxis protein